MCARACVMGPERGGALAGQTATAVCETFVICKQKKSCVRNTTDRLTVTGRSARACAVELTRSGNASRRSRRRRRRSPEVHLDGSHCSGNHVVPSPGLCIRDRGPRVDSAMIRALPTPVAAAH